MAFFATALISFTAVPIEHAFTAHSLKDYFVWYEAGSAVLRGDDVYPAPEVQKFPFMYPPPCALFLAAPAALGQAGLIIVLALLCAAAWVAVVVLSAQLVTGDWRTAPLPVFIVPNVVCAVYVWSNFLLGQPSLLLLALMLGAFVLLQRNSQAGAGALLAFATAIKAFPLLSLVYLIYRRYWIAAAALVAAVVILFCIVPLPFRGVALARTDLTRWTNGMLLKYDDSGVCQRAGRSYSWRNQSIWGVANRLLRHVESDPAYGPHVPTYANFADLSFSTVNAMIGGAALLCGLAYVAVMPRRRLRNRETDAIEFALLLLLILLFTPMTFGYMFAWLLFPYAVVTHRLLGVPNGPLLGLASVATTLLALTAFARVGAQTYGNVFFAALLLFVGLAIELRRLNVYLRGASAVNGSLK